MEGRNVDQEQCGRFDKWVAVAAAPGQAAVQREPTDSDWLPGIGNVYSEWEVGHAPSRAECVRLARENCPNARSIAMPAGPGGGSCWCQADWGDDACSYDSFFCGSQRWCNITVNGVLFGMPPDGSGAESGIGSGRCQDCNCAAFDVCAGDCSTCAAATDEAAYLCCSTCNDQSVFHNPML